MNLPEDLQAAIRETRAVVRAGYPWWLRAFVLPGVAGITLGRRVYVVSTDDRVLRHELIHVRQILRLGVIRFYLTWVSEYLRNRLTGMSADEAYRRISFEEEAFSGENI